MTPSELNMADSGEGSEFEFEFSYDGLHLDPGLPVDGSGVVAAALGGNNSKPKVEILQKVTSELSSVQASRL